jgi:hypothetical protein
VLEFLKRVLLGPPQDEVDDQVQRDELSSWRSVNCVGSGKCFSLDRIPKRARRVALLLILFCWSFCAIAIPVLVVAVVGGTADSRFNYAAVCIWLATQPPGFAGVLAGLTKTVRATWASAIVFSICSALLLAVCCYGLAQFDAQLIQSACTHFDALSDCSHSPRLVFYFLIGTLVVTVAATCGGLMLHSRFLRVVTALKKWRYQQLHDDGTARATEHHGDL